jgi:hypothetical protein
MKAESAIQTKKETILRELGATTVNFHGAGSGDIDIVIDLENKTKRELRKKINEIFRRELGRLMGSTIHVYTTSNAPSWLKQADKKFGTINRKEGVR